MRMSSKMSMMILMDQSPALSAELLPMSSIIIDVSGSYLNTMTRGGSIPVPLCSFAHRSSIVSLFTQVSRPLASDVDERLLLSERIAVQANQSFAYKCTSFTSYLPVKVRVQF